MNIEKQSSGKKYPEKNIVEYIIGGLEAKRQWRALQGRIKILPGDYRIAVKAIERYLMYFAAVDQSDVLIRMEDDLVTLFEQAAAEETPVRDVVGGDPTEFVETFTLNYGRGDWINKERQRLIDAIDKLDTSEKPGDANEGGEHAR